MPAPTNAYLILSEKMFNANTGTSDNDPESAYGTGVSYKSGAIEVLNFGFKVEQVGAEEGGRPRSVEKTKRSDLVIKKVIDSRSPKLYRWCCEGAFIKEAELQLYAGTDTPFAVYWMSFVHISSYEVSGGGAVPTEEIGLRFGKMGVKFNNAGIGTSAQGNSKTGSVQGVWNWVEELPASGPFAALTEIGGLTDGNGSEW